MTSAKAKARPHTTLEMCTLEAGETVSVMDTERCTLRMVTCMKVTGITVLRMVLEHTDGKMAKWILVGTALIIALARGFGGVKIEGGRFA
jgi:hypothetical protein